MASHAIITKTVEENKHTNKNVETFYHKERQRWKNVKEKNMVTKMGKISPNIWLLSIKVNELNIYWKRDHSIW